ncbi:DUF5672 family protein [Chishuiella changwenlii]|uniref:DUF5672 family protein n=1 Tax=Chishuiella changwenlii TaxID=1434701 RepID=UPI002FD9AFD9
MLKIIVDCMVNLNKVIIVIPIYQDFLDEFEKKSLESIICHFNEFEIVFVAPNGMTTKSYENYFSQLNNWRLKYFSSDCFISIEAYNKLLLDTLFYKCFAEYEYMLICQLDVYVFKNDLLAWCQKGYDYVGAPWIGSSRNFINLTFEKFNRSIRKLKGKRIKNTEILFKVGNGGFSLRKIEKFIHITREQNREIELFLKTKPETEYHVEDVFWSLYVPKKYKDFKIPGWKEALNFCIDRKPKKALNLNNNQLPMACHRFNQPNPARFWKKYINF